MPNKRNNHLVRTAAAKRERQDAFLALVRRGMTYEQALDEMGLGAHTLNKWRYQPGANGPDHEFQRRVQEAKRYAEKRDVVGIPDFLTFREDSFAYVDLRKTAEIGKCPATGLPWYSRARTSAYVEQATAALEAENRLIMVMPPGHLKSTIFGVERTVYDLVKDRDFRALLVQKNQDEASKQVGQVKERLSSHDYYHFRIEVLEKQGDEPIQCVLCKYEDGVPFKPEFAKAEANAKWGTYGFIVGGRTSGEKDYSMQAVGINGSIQGGRFDRIVLDDVQDPQQGKKNPQDSLDKLSVYRDIILGRVTDLQDVVVLANFFSPDDFAHKLIEALPDHPVINFPALDPKGDPLAPEFWSKAGLEIKKKEVGPATWEVTWMQNLDNWASATFNRDAMNAAKDEDLIVGDVPYAVTDIYIGVDPATSDTGHCAMVVWGLDRRTKQRYLIDVFNKTQMRHWNNVSDQIAEYCRTYQGRVRYVIVEGNNTQKAGLSQHPYFIKQITELGTRHKIYQTVTGTGGRSKSANFDITTIAALFDGGHITLPYGGTFEDREKIDAFVDQLSRWRTDEQGNSVKHLKRDMVMALLFAESEAFEVANKRAVPIIQNYNPRASLGWSRKKNRPVEMVSP